jgi:hypothetical protein
VRRGLRWLLKPSACSSTEQRTHHVGRGRNPRNAATGWVDPSPIAESSIAHHNGELLRCLTQEAKTLDLERIPIGLVPLHSARGVVAEH